MAEAAPGSSRRVCFVIDRLAARSGGAERVLVETANALAARGHWVEIVTHEHRGKPPFYPLAFGVTHTNLRWPGAVRGRLRRRIDRARDWMHREVRAFPFPVDRLLWLSKHGAFQRRLARHLDLHQPDVAIALLPPAITALGRARLKHPLRRVASLHNVPEQDLCNPERWDPNPLDRRRRMEALARCDAITVLLPEFRDWFPADLRAKVSIIPNSVKLISMARVRRFTRQKTVIAIGRLAPVKRYGLLLDAWARLGDSFPDWTLKIFGIGPLKDELAARIGTLGIAKTAHLMGHTDAIEEQLLSASILAHPAEYEGWGLAVTEALAAGVPVIGFADCPGVNQLIRHGESGLLVPAGGDRAAGLAEALGSLMSDDIFRGALAKAAPETVRAYAPDKVIDLWERILF